MGSQALLSSSVGRREEFINVGQLLITKYDHFFFPGSPGVDSPTVLLSFAWPFSLAVVVKITRNK